MDQPDRTAAPDDRSEDKLPWSPPAIEEIDVAAQTQGTFSGVGADSGIYS